MNKKTKQQVSIYAQQFLRAMRQKTFKKMNIQSIQSEDQKIQKQPLLQEKKESMQLQMGSDSQIQAEKLFQDIEQNQSEKQIQMRSDSQMEAEQLFQHLDPNSIEMKPKQEVKKQKIKRKQEEVRKKIGIQKQQKKIEFKEKNKKEREEQENKKFIKTKSILLSGKQKNRNSNIEQEQVKVQHKSVSFYLPVSSQVQKKWKDPIQNQRKGKFDTEQARIITQAVGKFIALNDITFDQFQKAMSSQEKSDKLSRRKKIFSLLSTVLPNRSAQSCYKYVKRNFNSLNRKGQWSQEEVQELKNLVQKYGRKWTIIAKHLKRTNDNVYDKYRSLGQQNMDQISNNLWKIRELILLLKLIQKMSKVNFIDHNLDKQLQRQDYHDLRQKQQVSERKYNSKNFIFHNIEVIKPFINSKNFQKVKIQNLRWSQLSATIKTKTINNCRSKFIQLLQIFFYTAPKQFDEEIVDFLKQYKVSSINEINWKNWKSKLGSAQQAKNRFLIMKKHIQGRSVKNFHQVVQQMKNKVSKKKEQN